LALTLGDGDAEADAAATLDCGESDSSVDGAATGTVSAALAGAGVPVSAIEFVTTVYAAPPRRSPTPTPTKAATGWPVARADRPGTQLRRTP
jgi:hypothetical protein